MLHPPPVASGLMGEEAGRVMAEGSRQQEQPRVVMWQGIWRLGTEWCDLSQVGDGWRLTGAVLLAVGGAPAEVRYEIAIDASWATRAVDITSRSGSDVRMRRIHLAADQQQIWHRQDSLAADAAGPSVELEEVRGLLDIDLGFSPSTNTLPIRRLAPEIGEAVDVTAVWLRYPELTIAPLPQRYIRLDERRYRYESNGGAFVAELEVDALGLVVAYEGGWQRIAEAEVGR